MRAARTRLRWGTVALAALIALAPVLVLVLAGTATADNPAGFTTVVVQAGLDAGPGGNPTSFAYAPDGRIFVGRKAGVVDVWHDGVEHVFLDIRDEVNSVQARGLIGLALDPSFATNGRVYVLFTQELDPANPNQGGPAGGQLISITVKAGDPDSADPASRVTLVTGFDSTARLHSVAGLRFDNDGNLLVGFADGSDNGVNEGQALRALDLDLLNGKILRIDPTTGAGIPGNPYFDAADPTSVRSRVYARGFRNPFRFTVDPQNGNVYVGEVGWNTWEQLDVITPTFTDANRDRNAGWPCYEGGNGTALVQPDYQSAPVSAATCHAIYKPSEGGTGVGSVPPTYGYLHDPPDTGSGSAIVGGPKYTGTSNYPAQYVGQVFIGDYARDRMQAVDPTTGAATDFGTPGTWGAPVDIQIAPDGNVAWLGIYSAELREIVYTGDTDQPPTASAKASPSVGETAPLAVHFSATASTDPDAGDVLTYTWDFGDGSAPSTKMKPRHVFTKIGAYTVTLTVSDGHPGGTDTDTVHVSVGDDPPTIAFAAPDRSVRYAIGDQIDIDLVANDNEDGPLTGSSVSTTIIQHANGHLFPAGQFDGTSGSFVAADLGFENTYYELQSTATDSTGQTTTAVTNVLPATKAVTIASAPTGVSVTVDGVSRTTPYTWSSIVGSRHEVVAPVVTTVGEVERTFASWTAPGGTSPSTFASFSTPAAKATVSVRYNPVANGFAISDASVVEGQSGFRTVALTVSRSTPSGSESSVDWATVAGTAKTPSDFTAASGSVVFAAGETSHVVTIAVKGNLEPENDQQFSVQLSNPQGDVIVQPTGTVTILNDDPSDAGLRIDAGDVDGLEGANGTRSAAFTVSLSAPSPGGVTVDYTTVDGTAVEPSDYAAAAGTLTFDAGQVSKTVDVAVSGDTEGESSEAFTLVLSNPVGATVGRGTGTAFIAADDARPTVSVSSGNFFEGDAGKPKIPFTVSLSVPSANPVTVEWTASHVTTDDSDLKLKSGSVTIPAGAVDAVIDVTATGDTLVEPDESFTVTLANAVGATIGQGTTVEVIRNDDPSNPPIHLAIGDVAIGEGEGGARTAQFLVTLSAPAGSPVSVHYTTVDGTATTGGDYVSKTGNLTFPAGAVTRVITVPIIGDSLHEGNQTFTVVLSSPLGAVVSQAVGSGTILDDD